MYFAHTYQADNEIYEGHMMGHSWGDGGMSIFWMILWLVIVVIGITAALSYIQRTKSESTDPLNELKNRYAKGEIDKKEYESIKKDLSEK